MVTMRLGTTATVFNTQASFRESGYSFPDQLGSVTIGGNYMHQLGNGWRSGIIVAFDSASDRPFASPDEVSCNLGFMLQIPAHEQRDNWRLSMMYSLNGQRLMPLPLVAYDWNPSHDLRVGIGLPATLRWKPVADLTITANYIPLYTGSSKATVRLSSAWQVFAGYEYAQDGYLLHDSPYEGERLFLVEQRVKTGLGWTTPWIGIGLEVSGGYAFDRHFGFEDSAWSCLHDRLDVRNGWFAGVSARVAW